ncbi:MAG: hypothetical protein ABI821_14600 [Pseudomonadota bacterium]
MNASNVALRLEPAEDQPEPPLEQHEILPTRVPEKTGMPLRPRRTRAFRTIVIRDQGLRLFRCG